MTTVAQGWQGWNDERRVDLAPRVRRYLTGRDVLRIARLAEQAQVSCHISYGAQQALIGVPEAACDRILEAFRAMGYECDVFPGETNGVWKFLAGTHE